MPNKIKSAVRFCLKQLQHKPITAEIIVVEPQKLLVGKSALITGGTSGIGKAIASEFYKAGAFVVITSRNGKKAEDVAKTIDPTGKNVVGVELDSCKVCLFETTLREIKSLLPISSQSFDILVNNAGVVGGGYLDYYRREV